MFHPGTGEVVGLAQSRVAEARAGLYIYHVARLVAAGIAALCAVLIGAMLL